MNIAINNQKYIFLKDYRESDQYRLQLNALVKIIFGISFEDWYQAGYWNDKYIPYTLFDTNKAVANISVNIMDFNVLGKQQRYIQIGTVATDESYRNKKLSRFLMEKVLDDWRDKCDLIYLYANKSVLDMYPKYGFSITKEYEYFKSVEKDNRQSNYYEKLNMDKQSNRDMLYDYAKNSATFSKLSMKDNADLVMFYCMSFFKEYVYYINSLDVIAVAKIENNQLYVFDIFGKVEVDLDKVINTLVNSKIDKVILRFTPNNCSSYELREIIGDDTLFIQNGKSKVFDVNKVMFPLLSHA